MSIHSLADLRERNRAAADSVLAEVAREVQAARDTIMSSALRRLAAADPQATLDPTVERLGRIWVEAWPFGQGVAP
jgi:hypothetical protein